MKQRLGGEKLTARDKLLMHRLHYCPGNIYHKVPNRERIFERYHKVSQNHGYQRGHKAYTMYWRSHPQHI